MEILPGEIRYLGARPSPIRTETGRPAPGFALMFRIPNGEVHEALVAQEGFTEEIGREAIIAAAKPFLELAKLFPDT